MVTMTRATVERVLNVEGMTCGSCAAKVTNSLEKVDGVLSAEVSQPLGRAVVSLDHNVPFETLAAAASVGGTYRVTPGGDGSALPTPPVPGPSSEESLFPLFLIVGFISGTALLVAFASGQWVLETTMRHFMAGFFLVFSFFKLLDLKGFVDAYRTYDILAKALPGWAWVYPFVELGLGIAYLLAVAPIVVNSITFVLMLVGSVGVLKALKKKQSIQCACLGTALNLPMTKVTLVEDLVMAAMAAGMLTLLSA